MYGLWRRKNSDFLQLLREGFIIEWTEWALFTSIVLFIWEAWQVFVEWTLKKYHEKREYGGSQAENDKNKEEK